jgi:hypothetical protein
MRTIHPPKEIVMRKLMLPVVLLGAAALTGCVGYGGGTYGAGGVYYDNSPYYGGSYYGGAPYYGGTPYYGASGGVVVIEQRSGYPYRGYTRRDRDGDGVPDRYDTRPNNPRRY